MRVRLMTLGLVWLALAAPVQAEPFVDLYGGWSKGQSTDVSASQRTCFVVGCTAATETTRHQAFQSDAAAGILGGHWFHSRPWFGLAGDLSYSRTASDQVKLDSMSLAATPMLRLPLWTTPERPHGHLQPYVGAGPTLVFHRVSADFRPASPVILNGWSMALGWTARAGLAVPVSDHVAVFGEWRLSQDRVSLRDAGFFGQGEQGRLDLTRTTQQTLFGLSYRF